MSTKLPMGDPLNTRGCNKSKFLYRNQGQTREKISEEGLKKRKNVKKISYIITLEVLVYTLHTHTHPSKF